MPTKLGEWISPLEASLEMSIRRGVYISPDDIKQLRNKGRLPEDAYITVSNRSSIYKRKAIQDFEGLKKRANKVKPIDTSHVTTWLWEFPHTIQSLEEDGYTIPKKEQAIYELEKIRANKQKNPNPRKIDSKTP